MEVIALAVAAFAVGAATMQSLSVLWADFARTRSIARLATACMFAAVAAGGLATLGLLFHLRPAMSSLHLLATLAGAVVTFYAYKPHVRVMLGLPPFAKRLPPWWS